MKIISLAGLRDRSYLQRISKSAFLRALALRFGAIFLIALISTSSEAGPPPVGLSAASLSFSSQIVNTTSGAKLVTLKNRQSVPLTIASVSVTGDFAQTNNCPITPQKLAAGATCTFSVSFTPIAVGTRTGKLVITDTAATSPQSVTLSGTGTLTGLTAIAITPGGASINKGTQQQFTATGTFTGGVKSNITNVVSWTSSNTVVATVSSTGLASGLSVGTSTVRASSGTISGSAALGVVSSAVLQSITVAPSVPSIAKGQTQQFVATGTYNDGSTQNLTSVVSWSSSQPGVATISSAGLATGVGPGAAVIAATSGTVSGSTTLTVTTAALVSIAITPGNSSIALGTKQQFTATGTYTDGSTLNITSSVSWTSSVPAVATVSNAGPTIGLGSSITTGQTTVIATFGSIVGSTALTVTPANLVSISVTPAVPSISLGTTKQFTAIGTYTDGSTQNITGTVTWSSSSPAVATISSVGLATSKITGTTTIAASSGAVSGSTTLTVTSAALVSIAITPANPSIALGTNQQFTATGTYTDGSTLDIISSVTWSSSVPAIATISNTVPNIGQATSVTTGQTTIVATSGSITGSIILTVTPATLLSINVAPALPTIPLGNTQQFTATGTYTDGTTQNITTMVSWSSNNPGVATISNSVGTNGLAASAGTGQTTITATLGSVTGSSTLTVSTAALVSIAVSPLNSSIALGSTQQFTATGTYTDGSTQNITTTVTWVSNTGAVATISNSAGTNGLATTAGTGQTTIAATLGSVTGSTNLTVSSAALVSIALSPLNSTIALGNTQQFTATGTYTDGSTQNITTTVNWSSNNAAVATISNSTGTNGLATSAGTGQTTITATLGSVTSSTTLTVSTATLVSIAVSPLNSSIALGSTQQLTATGTYTDGSTQNITTTVSWSSNNPAAATISNSAGTNGLATSAGTGQTTITATLGSVTGSTTLTVSTAALVSIIVSPLNSTIALGSTQQFTATGTYTDGSTQNITTTVSWSSNNAGVATISNSAGTNGLATSAGTGQTTITATLGSVTGSTTLTVSTAALLSITLSPLNSTIALGNTQQFTATGSFTDGSTQNITTTVNWSSNNAGVATISNSAGTNGLATSAGTGQTTITAALGSVTGSSTLTVSTAALVSIAVSPLNSSIAPGSTQQFTATGTYADGSKQNITTTVSWSSNNAAAANISNSAGKNGLATGVGNGQTTIAAKLGSVTGSTTLTVNTAALVSIVVSPLNSTIASGSTQQFTATGNYADGSTLNITATVSWSSNNAVVATISNSVGTNGLATSSGAGQTTITATLGSMTGSTTLAVNTAALSSIALSPLNSTIPLGATQQFTATGTYTDGSRQNITATVMWSSNTPAVATISNSAGTNAIATGAATGQTTITATMGSLTGSATLTVGPAALSSIGLSPLHFTITVGSTQQFTATGTYTDHSTQSLGSSALWSSTNPSIFSVNTTGLAVSAGPGTATVSATLNGVTGSTNLTVTSPTNLPTVSCFFQNGVVNGGQSYWGNAITRDNNFSPRPTEVIPAYQRYGNNATIFDGPVVHIGTPCVLTSVTYFTGISPNLDPYQKHFVCQGTGATNGQGATVVTTQPVTAGPCATGDVAVGYTNTYDVGLYCVSNGQGECVYGQLYCNVGPIPYNIASPSQLRLATFNCNQGAIVLPPGDYGVMMATNCDNGSVAGPNGVGASVGGGDQPCLTGMGESGPFGSRAVNGAFDFGSQIYGWKYFTFMAGQFDSRGGHCLIYDPLHDNSIGLPPNLTSYDNGGCSMVHNGQVKLAPSGQAPHTLGFTWWSTQ